MGALPWDLLGVAQERPSENFELNKDSPQAEGLVAWYPLAAPENLARDFSGLGYDLPTVSGAGVKVGPFGRYLNFPSSANYVEGAVSPVSAYPFTVSHWVRARTGDLIGTVISLNEAGEAVMRTLGNTTGFWSTEVAGARADSTKAVIAGEWVLVTGIWYSTTLRSCFVNGGNKGSDATSKAFVPTSQVQLNRNITSAGLNLDLFHTCIWNRALTDSDVRSLYNPATRWDLYWRPRLIVPGFVPAEGGRIMSSLTAEGGLAGMGGIAGAGGGLAG